MTFGSYYSLPSCMLMGIYVAIHNMYTYIRTYVAIEDIHIVICPVCADRSSTHRLDIAIATMVQ